jgi:hypothetical protein
VTAETVEVGPTLLVGSPIAKEIRARLREEMAAFTAVSGRAPTLVVVFVGRDAPSAVYLQQILKSCENVGAVGRVAQLAEGCSAQELRRQIEALNADSTVDGIIVQMPLPAGIPLRAVIDAIDPAKDIDGLHPENAGLLAEGYDGFLPATAQASVEILKRSGIAIEADTRSSSARAMAGRLRCPPARARCGHHLPLARVGLASHTRSVTSSSSRRRAQPHHRPDAPRAPRSSTGINVVDGGIVATSTSPAPAGGGRHLAGARRRQLTTILVRTARAAETGRPGSDQPRAAGLRRATAAPETAPDDGAARDRPPGLRRSRSAGRGERLGRGTEVRRRCRSSP